jgi:hypothetical protein
MMTYYVAYLIKELFPHPHGHEHKIEKLAKEALFKPVWEKHVKREEVLTVWSEEDKKFFDFPDLESAMGFARHGLKAQNPGDLISRKITLTINVEDKV